MSEARVMPTNVVTVFVENAGRVLVLRRSGRVGTYRGAWAGVAGYMDGLPLAQAYTELGEEVSLSDRDVRLQGIGIPVPVYDPELDRTWLVHPFLFHTADPSRVITDWESDEARWIDPREMSELVTVPGLDRALSAVWPAFGDDEFWGELASVATDTVHGATSLAMRGLSALDGYLSRDRAAPRERAVRALAACRPSMGVFPHLAARLLLEELTTASLCDELERSTLESASRAAAGLAGCGSILTISYSSAVKDTILRRAAQGGGLRIVVAESRPECEGVVLARDLAASGVRVSVITDAQIGLFAGEVDCVLAGCDAVTGDNLIQNKAGTSLMVCAARAAGVPCFAVTQTAKVAPSGFPIPLEEQAPSRVGEAEGVRFRNVVFDRTPIAMFDAVYTENGVLTVDGLSAIRSRLDAARLVSQ